MASKRTSRPAAVCIAGPADCLARLIEVYGGGKVRCLLTTLCDRYQSTAWELVLHYIQRGEIELGVSKTKVGSVQGNSGITRQKLGMLRSEV
jgi:hypothetical protein